MLSLSYLDQKENYLGSLLFRGGAPWYARLFIVTDRSCRCIAAITSFQCEPTRGATFVEMGGTGDISGNKTFPGLINLSRSMICTERGHDSRPYHPARRPATTELRPYRSAPGYSLPFCSSPGLCQRNPYVYAIRKERRTVS